MHDKQSATSATSSHLPNGSLHRATKEQLEGEVLQLRKACADRQKEWGLVTDILDRANVQKLQSNGAGQLMTASIAERVQWLVKQRDEWCKHVADQAIEANQRAERFEAEAAKTRTLLCEVLNGTRNSPGRRARDLLAGHGLHVPENTETFESMREQRDDARKERESMRAQRDSTSYITDQALAFMCDAGAKHDEGAFECARRVLRERDSARSSIEQIREACNVEGRKCEEPFVSFIKRLAQERDDAKSREGWGIGDLVNCIDGRIGKLVDSGARWVFPQMKVDPAPESTTPNMPQVAADERILEAVRDLHHCPAATFDWYRSLKDAVSGLAVRVTGRSPWECYAPNDSGEDGA